ncbi:MULTISPECIES: hypothetical protein [Mesoflavibacter]|uniref:Uncharacterized protein n=1 Tax=Mesoflavibacter profundi TaxID=2708110 RepID=A0ABT4S1C8_9FLAO|nr:MULTISPECIES: hypothetical protein [Mesoflavibacter]MDA0177870.1 hypothetical protein [Mesoflavibacter profundi]QIJ88831.1 hypothetical protein C7H62_1022 [Mesoflavibacter sp. HG96]QIJ91559.1 hypothetical protein C7H56_1022 [Mesoflavibacter sp. HG37]
MQNIIKGLIVSVLSILFFQCFSAQKLSKTASFEIQNPYYQHWIAGVKNGGSGINVFISLSKIENSTTIDSLYFRGQTVKLNTKPNNPNLFIGRILTKANQNEDFQLNIDANSLFDVKENEAVIIYTENDIKKYYKIEHIKEKQAEFFPSAPPKQN